MATFRYAPELLARYPAVVGGVMPASGLHNGPSPDALRAEYAAEQEAVRERIGETPLSQTPSLAAWRAVFRGFGLDPTQYRGAAEALLRRLTKKGEIPSVNTLVDIGNLVSIRYALPVALFDLRATSGTITVRFATGDERYTTLNESGEAQPTHPEPGEVIFSDETGLVIARRWCWRQSDESAMREDSTRALVTVEAHHKGGRTDVAEALGDLQTLLARYAGGEYLTAILDAEHPEF
ncbi:MAG TPA: phenylalanine--tRNA ligase beta subunit-related protein [Ktedonobacterales bacterium]|jgi:DNA/RNA-binding domain of Phe-tRNA-synthetase-like protein